MCKFKVEYDTPPEFIVDIVAGAIGAFGLKIETIDDSVDGLIEYEVKQDPESIGLTFPDIRNKLSPFTNLIAMLESGIETDALKAIVKKEIEQCKESIKYLKGGVDEISNKTLDNMSLSDLSFMQAMLEKEVEGKQKWVDSERGYSYDEYSRREYIFHHDEVHNKLKLVNERIEKIIKSV